MRGAGGPTSIATVAARGSSINQRADAPRLPSRGDRAAGAGIAEARAKIKALGGEVPIGGRPVGYGQTGQVDGMVGM